MAMGSSGTEQGGNTLDMEELMQFAQLVDYLMSNYYRKGSALATKQRERAGQFFCAVQDLMKGSSRMPEDKSMPKSTFSFDGASTGPSLSWEILQDAVNRFERMR